MEDHVVPEASVMTPTISNPEPSLGSDEEGAARSEGPAGGEHQGQALGVPVLEQDRRAAPIPRLRVEEHSREHPQPGPRFSVVGRRVCQADDRVSTVTGHSHGLLVTDVEAVEGSDLGQPLLVQLDGEHRAQARAQIFLHGAIVGEKPQTAAAADELFECTYQVRILIHAHGTEQDDVELAQLIQRAR